MSFGLGQLGAGFGVIVSGGGNVLPSWLPLAGGQAPTLYADFTKGNYWYNKIIYPSFASWNTAIGGTFSRSSSATYLNSGTIFSASSGVARFPADINGNPTGIRLTGAGTNIHFHSNIGDATGSYTFLSGTATGSIADPAGNTNAVSFVPAAASGQHIFYLTGYYNSVLTTTYTWSIFAKSNGYTQFQMDEDNSTTKYATFNLTGNGSVVFNTGLNSYGITNLANGWYYCWINFTATSIGLTAAVIYTTGNANARNWTGDGTSGYSFFGEQITASVFPLDYIPTTTGTVTQAADAFSATWAAITSGTLFAKATTGNAAAARRIIQIDDGTDNNRATLSFNASAAGAFDFISGSSSEAALSAGTIVAGTASKEAAAFAVNDFSLVVSNGTPATGSSGTIPALSAIRFGADTAGGNNLYGDLAQVAVWNNTRVSNAGLGVLTT